ncbi:phospholipase [Salmonella enterica subsp. enterica]|nr:phospholipase [Salmonella enterica subsp. enterica]
MRWGKKLHAALLKAAQRGVKAEVLLDGYGSPDLSDAFVGELTSAGVIFRYYDPPPASTGVANQYLPPNAPQNCGD